MAVGVSSQPETCSGSYQVGYHSTMMAMADKSNRANLPNKFAIVKRDDLMGAGVGRELQLHLRNPQGQASSVQSPQKRNF